MFLNEKPPTDTSTWIRLGDVVKLKCSVRGKNEFARVGATIINTNGRELDFHVSPAQCRQGSFGLPDTVYITLSAVVTQHMCPDDPMWPADLSLRLVVRLWETRVFADDCTLGNPVDGKRPCKYCRKNGYHMEGPIGKAWMRKVGTYYAGY